MRDSSSGGPLFASRAPDTTGRGVSRRGLLKATAALSAAAASGACGRTEAAPRSALPALIAAREKMRATPGGRTVDASVTAAVRQVDLGGLVVPTWTYDGTVPGKPIRVRAGDTLRLSLRNNLPEDTSLHWHGIALRNDMDGPPKLTGPKVPKGTSTRFEFVVPDAGTYFAHPHSGLQSDRGLYFPVVVDDPADPGGYDVDEVLMLDDWLDGTGRPAQSPELAMQALQGSRRSMQMAAGAASPWGPDLGDVSYPLHLLNGRLPSDPYVVRARPGAKVRLRVVNAGADTAYRFSIEDHRLTVTHADGFPVVPVTVDELLLGMGERYDVTVTAKDGAFRMLAAAEGKPGAAAGVLRTGTGAAGGTATAPSGRLLTYADLAPDPSVRLEERPPDREVALVMRRQKGPYRWSFSGPDGQPTTVRPGERLRLVLENDTSMFHPVHVHGHTFALADEQGRGVRKDTVVVTPGQRLAIDVQADNPGRWLVHCHNLYHMEAGMMTQLDYDV